MDESLLKKALKPVLYHIQVNIYHNISLALSFLHSNKIIHGDLFSNNMLLIGNSQAKVTDFGMARLENYLTYTTCPGADVYVPPEALKRLFIWCCGYSNHNKGVSSTSRAAHLNQWLTLCTWDSSDYCARG